MKSIEEKAKAYDEVLGKLREFYRDYDTVSSLIDVKEELANILPEIKESEDECIRKELKALVTWTKSYSASGVTMEDAETMMNWLEKQGTSYPKKDVDDAYLKGISDAKEKLEKQNKQILANSAKTCKDEQKPADKVEPKFHEGDWIISNTVNEDYRICKITDINNGYYTIESIYGYKGYNYFNVFEELYRLWTIEDAKDGDVLCDYHEAFNNPLIFILKKFEHVNFGLVKPSDYSSYCFLTSGDRQRFKEGTYHHKHNIKPATKEQRDLLFSKMKEEGYEWDAENKELKKIEDEEYNGEDYGIDSLWHAKHILEKTLGKVDGYQSDDGILEHKCAITAIKKLYKQKPAEWSEDDEKMLDGIILRCEKYGYQEQIDWLKSLKIRVQPKQEWGEEDEKMRNNLIRLLIRLSANTQTNSTTQNYSYPNEIDWLKSLKDRVGYEANCTTTKEWSEEDIRNIENIDSILFYDKDLPEDTCVRLRNWLKSLKQRYTWKPSEEIMKGLNEIINKLAISPVIHEHGYLYDLMVNLRKKLIE